MQILQKDDLKKVLHYAIVHYDMCDLSCNFFLWRFAKAPKMLMMQWDGNATCISYIKETIN